MDLKTIISISRPRFWLYLAGTYLVGFSFGVSQPSVLLTPFFIIHFLYFLLPANFLLYGINDYFDEDTDQFNQKKGSYEHKLKQKEKVWLLALLLICLAFSFFILALQMLVAVQLLLLFFLLLAYGYSADPPRFKAKPFLDFSSNALYFLPALIGYYQTTESFPSFIIILGLFCWTASMQLFSAIPDIAADKKANLNTSAVLFGKQLSLVVCGVLWLTSALVALFTIDSYLAVVVIIYPLIPLLLLITKAKDIGKVYRYFPYINAFVGCLLFFIAILK